MTNRFQSLCLLGGLVLFCVSATDVLGGGAVTPLTTVVDKSTNTVLENTMNTFSTLAGYVLITVTSCTQVNGSASFYECNVYGSSAPANAVNSSNITASLLGNIVTLSWPAAHLGWRLQVQTNSLLSGWSTNWAAVP